MEDNDCTYGEDTGALPGGTFTSWVEDKVFAWSDSPTPARFTSDLLCVAVIMATATFVGFAFLPFGMETCIVIIYVLAVLCASLLTVRRIHCVIASVVSVLLYNFMFVSPRFSFKAWGSAYPVTFAVMFAVSLVASSVAVTLRRELHASRLAYRRTRVVLEADKALRRCETAEQVVASAGTQLSKLLGASVIWYSDEGGDFAAQRRFFARDDSPSPVVELSMARRAQEDDACVGAGTSLFPSAVGFYLPLRCGERVVGVMGICLNGRSPLPAERNEAEMVAGEASLALSRVEALEEREKAAVMAKNEQLRANLLRSISHDLRTPLTAISGNADVLLADGDALAPEKRCGLLHDIRSDAIWLNATVENLLAITRLENGEMQLATTTELLDDVVEEALRHVNPDATLHHIDVEPGSEMLLVDVDARLMVQVIANLVNNAIIYTPEGSHIRIVLCEDGDKASVRVEDDGPGIAEKDRAHIFESFYTVGHTLADSKRSVGLGLSLCKSIVEAHGGSIAVLPVVPHGCAFEFHLPMHDLTQKGTDYEC